jgi:hypothetical protein
MRLKKQIGSAMLLEMSIVAILAGLASAAAIWSQKQALVDAAYTAQGTLMKRIRNAADTYQTTYYTQLISDTPVIPGVASPAQPTVAELIALNMLPQGFQQNGIFGQQYKIKITRSPLGCSGNACTSLQGVVYLDAPLADSVGLGTALTEIGADGAYSTTNNPGTLYGISGSINIPNPLGNVANVLGAQFGYNTGGFAQFLRRDGTLPMTGALDMGNNKAINTTGIFRDINGTTGTLNLGPNVKVGTEVGVASGVVNTGTAVLESNVAQALLVKGESMMSGLNVTGNGTFGGSIVANDIFDAYRKQWLSQLAPDIVMKGSQVIDLKANPNIAKPNCGKPVANGYGTSVDSSKPYTTDITSQVSGGNQSAGVARIYATPVAGVVGSYTAVKGTLTSQTNPDGSTTFTQTIDNTDGAAGLFDMTATDTGAGYWQISYNTRNYPQEAIALVQVACKY